MDNQLRQPSATRTQIHDSHLIREPTYFASTLTHINHFHSDLLNYFLILYLSLIAILKTHHQIILNNRSQQFIVQQ